MTRIDYRVYLVTDEPSAYKGDFVENVEAALAGGVTVVQYRDTESNDRTAFVRVKRLREMLRARGVPLVMNNNPALALAVGAEAIHVGQHDLPVAVVRRLVGEKMEIGLSLTCLDDVREDGLAVADVVGIGPVWDARATKPDAAEAMGVAGFREIAQWALKPAIAIGGINLETAPIALSAGADGLAIVSAFSRAADPEEVARRFRALVDK